MFRIKILPAILFCFFIHTHSADAQQWFDFVKSTDPTLKEIQDSFYKFNKDHPVQADSDDDDHKGEHELPDIQFKRWEAFWLKRMKPEDHFPSPSTSYDAWEEYMKTHPHFLGRTQSQANWTFRGPLTSPGGYYGVGKANCIGFHPSIANTLWVGSAYGGLWKTTDGGATWSTNQGSMTNSGINDIAINPADANTMYLATTGTYGGVTRSVGILKSTNGGITFNTTTLNYTAASNVYFRKIIINPVDPNILLVAASNGVWKTANAGATWTRMKTGSFSDIKFNPANPAVVYASSYTYNSGYTAQIFRSTDNGDTWVLNFSLPGAGFTVLAVTPDNPSLVLTVSPNSQGGLFGLCRSTDGGASFSLIFQGSSTLNLLSYSETGTGTDGQGAYDITLAINPSNQNDVWVGGINAWRSTDGGLSWSIKNHWYGANGIPEVHADKHFHSFHPLLANTIFECNDGGVYRSSNSGVSWTDITNGLGISQIYNIGVGNAAGDNVICGLQDNATKHYVDQIWNETDVGGDGFKCIIDYTDTAVLYGSYYYGNVYKSADGGMTWNEIVNDAGSGVNSQGSFYTNYFVDPVNHNVLYIGKDQVYKTTNAGNTWAQLGSIASAQGVEWTIAAAPSNTQVIYAANYQTLYKSVNGGQSWTSLANVPGYISSISVDPLNARKIWFTYTYISGGGGNIYKSDDGGASFTNFTGTVPVSVGVNSIVYENGSADGLYIGTDIGVFYRDNTMSDWIYYNDGLPNIAVNDLQISYTNQRLWAGTFGRGLWSSALYNILPLTLIDFTATPVNKTASLKWTTSEEKNTREFTIERSEDDKKWVVRGTVKARNQSKNNTYSFVDNEPVNGNNYYRLKMIDKDGKFTYSDIRLVAFKEDNKALTIVPNPAHNYANLLFKTAVSSALIQLFDAQGKNVFTQNLQNHNSNIYRLNTRNFATGIYVLTIKSDDINAREQLVIQK